MIPSNETLIPIAVFLAISLGAWSLLGMAAARPRTAEDRLRRLLDGGGAVAAEANLAKRQEALQAKVAAAAGKLGPVAAPIRRARAGQDPAQAAQRRLSPGAGGRRVLRDQADRPHRSASP